MTRKLTKSLDFCQNYLCDSHLRFREEGEAVATEVAAAAVVVATEVAAAAVATANSRIP